MVFESALGGWSIDWAAVQNLLPRGVRACAYDRAGYGWSDASGHRSSPADVADELAALLDNAGETGPYLLVGHSLGGIYARQFAHRYPGQVAGMVMVDSAHEEMLRRFPSDSDVVQSTKQLRVLRPLRYLTITGVARLARMPVASHPDLPPEQQKIASAIGYRYDSYHAFYNEAAAFNTASHDTSFTTPDLPRVPAFVLASMQNLDDPNIGAISRRLQEELAASLHDAPLDVVDSGHFIHTQQPQTVADAIIEVLERSRARNGRDQPSG